MSKEKAITYINRAKEQLSDDLLTVRFCQMACDNLDKALKELKEEAISKTYIRQKLEESLNYLDATVGITDYCNYNIDSVKDLLYQLIKKLED